MSMLKLQAICENEKEERTREREMREGSGREREKGETCEEKVGVDNCKENQTRKENISKYFLKRSEHKEKSTYIS